MTILYILVMSECVGAKLFKTEVGQQPFASIMPKGPFINYVTRLVTGPAICDGRGGSIKVMSQKN